MSDKKTWEVWLLRGAAAVVVFVLGAVVGAAVTDSRTSESASELSQLRQEQDLWRAAQENLEDRNWALYLENTALRAQVDSAAADPGLASQGASMATDTAGQTLGDGIWVVGSDIEPGEYDGVVVGGSGYWARLKNTTGVVSGIITNGVPRGPFVLTINPTDQAVELRGVTLTPRE